MVNPILVALDVPDAEDALRLARVVEPHVGGFKVGLELLMGEGPAVVSSIAELGRPVFCDAKLHDIPNTVEAAARRIGASGARWLTVHASGGADMMKAAAYGLSDGSDGHAGVLAVTVLTSLDEAALAATGVANDIGTHVGILAALAAGSGAEGVVCSVRELGVVRAVAPQLTKVTPGVRPTGSAPGDQARVATPAEAVAAGADLLVIGRPITRADDPGSAAAAIVAGLTRPS